jgi:TorA maturation chaperone TorD
MTAMAHDHDLSRLPAVSNWLRHADAAKAVNAARDYQSDAATLVGMVRENVVFDLFDGLGRSRFLPYASYYLTGSLYGQPLARLRQALRNLGLEQVEQHSEP